MSKACLMICVNQRANPLHISCAMRGSLDLLSACLAEIEQRQLPIQLETFQCFGHCQYAPVIHCLSSGRFYHHVRLQDIPTILQHAQASMTQPAVLLPSPTLLHIKS